MNENRNNLVLTAFGLGMVAGAITALMLAPAPGHETRRRVGTFLRDVGERTRAGASAAAHAVRNQSHRLERAFHEGKEGYARDQETTG